MLAAATISSSVRAGDAVAGRGPAGVCCGAVGLQIGRRVPVRAVDLGPVDDAVERDRVGPQEAPDGAIEELREGPKRGGGAVVSHDGEFVRRGLELVPDHYDHPFRAQ